MKITLTCDNEKSNYDIDKSNIGGGISASLSAIKMPQLKPSMCTIPDSVFFLSTAKCLETHTHHMKSVHVHREWFVKVIHILEWQETALFWVLPI